MSSSPSLKLLVLRCADLERSHAFYHALGLRLTAEQHDGGPRHYSSVLGEVVLELYPLLDVASTGVRLGIQVADVCATVIAVRAVGGKVLGFHPDRTPPSALLQDPDGHKIRIEQVR